MSHEAEITGAVPAGAGAGLINPERTHPLSEAQKKIWYTIQTGNGDRWKAEAIAFSVRGDYELASIKQKLGELSAAHGVLRSRFHQFAGGRLAFSMEDGHQIPTHFHNLIPYQGEARQAELKQRIEAIAQARFEVINGTSVIAAHIVRLTPSETVIGFAAHPIIADAEMMTRLASDFLGRLTGRKIPLEVPDHLPLLLSDSDQLAYWRKSYATERINVAPPRLSGSSDEAVLVRGQVVAEISAQALSKLRHIAEDADMGLRLRLFTVLNALLLRYSGQIGFRSGLIMRTDSALGTGRLDRGADVVPIELHLTTDQNFTAMSAAVARAIDTARDHYVASELIIQEQLWAEGDQKQDLVKTSFDFRTSFKLPSDQSIKLLLAPKPLQSGDLSLTVQPEADGWLSVVFDFASEKFSADLMERFARHFRHLIENWAVRGDAPALSSVSLLTDAELAALSAPYADEGVNEALPVQDIIARHGVETPDRRAIMFKGQLWTHGELDKQVNRLANLLRHAGIGREKTVAVLINRSPEAIIANLAVLKAGGAYVPVVPDHPEARNHHILRDSGVQAVITQSNWCDKLPEGLDAEIIELDRVDLTDFSDTAPEVNIHPRQLAYIMYTSGSTGLPKGVAVEHGALTHHHQATARLYEMPPETCELPFLPFSSDGGHERWMVPLMVGGSIVLPDAALWTPQQTFAAIRKFGVTNASLPTAYMQQLAEWADLSEAPPPIRLYSFGGEGLAQSTFNLLTRSLDADMLINGYGPTETIMTPMIWKVKRGEGFDGAYAPIGRAVGNRRIYVLDPDMNPCPIGVVGELHIGGEGLARGYVGKPDTTAERFIPDPFGEPGGRLYKTGDLTRWREDGTVEFIGRIDHQIKLRGYRIEIGEIEAALLAQPGVGECIVILREEDGQKALVGYAVAEQEAEITEAELLRGMSQDLPEYMVPSALVVLDKMPTNANAKVDRHALPKPERAKRQLVAPETALEKSLQAIWKDILGQEQVGVTDNFFQIGGQSLAALKVLHALKIERPGDQTTIADFFNFPTIRELAAEIEKGGERTGRQVITLRASGDQPMLYCFPGLLVSTREYIKLVDYLGPDQPATGFICHSLSEEKTLNVSVEEIVAQYADHIRSQSQGRSCAFLGWSWGGLLAFEAARLLADEVDVRLVGMVDVCDLGEDFALGAVPHFAPGEKEKLQQEVDAWLAKTAMRREWDQLLNVMDDLAYDQFLKFIGNEKEPLPFDGPEISSREHTFWVLIDNALVFRQHKIKPHECVVHSWAAEDSLSRGLNLMDWRRFSKYANPAEIIDGTNHLHIIGAQAFHRRFADRLRQAFAPIQVAAQ